MYTYFLLIANWISGDSGGVSKSQVIYISKAQENPATSQIDFSQLKFFFILKTHSLDRGDNTFLIPPPLLRRRNVPKLYYGSLCHSAKNKYRVRNFLLANFETGRNKFRTKPLDIPNY